MIRMKNGISGAGQNDDTQFTIRGETVLETKKCNRVPPGAGSKHPGEKKKVAKDKLIQRRKDWRRDQRRRRDMENWKAIGTQVEFRSNWNTVHAGIASRKTPRTRGSRQGRNTKVCGTSPGFVLSHSVFLRAFSLSS